MFGLPSKMYLLMLLGGLAVAAGENEGDFLKVLETTGYSKYVPPSNPDDGGGVKVSMSMNIQNILNLDVDSQVLALHAWTEFYWNDHRLQTSKWNDRLWHTSNEEIPNNLVIPPNFIWTPDIILYNSARSFKPIEDVGAIVDNFGNVTYIPRMKIKAYCPMQDTIEANSHVICALKFGSWTRNRHIIDLELLNEGIVIDNHVSLNRKWQLVNATATVNAISYACCPEEYVDVTYQIELERTNVL